MRTVRAGSTQRAAGLVTRRSFSVASVAGRTRRSVAASAEVEGVGANAPTRQNAR
jgi:hypothetical protein